MTFWNYLPFHSDTESKGCSPRNKEKLAVSPERNLTVITVPVSSPREALGHIFFFYIIITSFGHIFF